MYEIKILNNNDFNSVAKSDPRYAFVDDSNMGFADREKKVAYVRQTHIHDLNKYLVTHELEELEKDESLHEDAYGIRHKKFFKDLILPNIGAIAGGLLGGPVGALAGGLGQSALGIGTKEGGGLFGGGGLLSSLFGGSSKTSDTSGFSGGYTSGGSGSYGNYSGSYSPLASFGNTYGSYSSGNLPQSFSGSYSPTITSGGINTTNQQGGEALDANLLEKLRGNYVGAINF